MQNVADWWETAERGAMTDADPMNPMRIIPRVVETVTGQRDRGLGLGSVGELVCPASEVHAVTCAARLSGTLATMGPGVPYAIGASGLIPERPTMALVGDGAMQMNGLAELITIERYWQQWTDPRLIVAVLHNNDLNQVTWEMRAMEGAPKFASRRRCPTSTTPASPQPRPGGETSTTPRRIGAAWERALAADRPTVLDIRCDPDVPPIPPHATFEQAKSVGQSRAGRGRGRRRVHQAGHQAEGPGVPPGQKED